MSKTAYYQLSDNLTDNSASSHSSRFRDAVCEKRNSKYRLDEHKLKVLYFFSALALVCIVHFAKFFYVDAGMDVLQIGCLQCVFYLSRFIGTYLLQSVEDWLVNTNRASSNACMKSLRTILIASVLLSSAFWAFLLFEPLQKFESFTVFVFLGSLTVSSSHGFLDIVAHDTITSSATKISYSAIRFWGLMALLLGSVAIGAMIDTLHYHVVFYLFLGFNFIFLMLIMTWFPKEHDRPHTYAENSLAKNLCGYGVFNVYIFLFCFGMLNAMPEILMLHLKIKFGMSYTSLGGLISLLAFGELLAYAFIYNCMDCVSIFFVGPLTALTAVALLFTSLRFSLWPDLDVLPMFFLLEVVQTALVTMFWMVALQQVNNLVSDYNAQGSINDDLESIWHFQSKAFGVLVGCILYETMGADACFNFYSTLPLILLVYYFVAFCPCRAPVKLSEIEEDNDSQQQTGEREALSSQEQIDQETIDSNTEQLESALPDLLDDDERFGDDPEFDDAVLEISDSGLTDNSEPDVKEKWTYTQPERAKQNAAVHQNEHLRSPILVF